MPRPIFGKVRKKIYDAASTAERSVAQTSNAADKSMAQTTEAVLLFLAKATEVVEEILDGAEIEGNANFLGKDIIPISIKLKLNIRE